ncbi:hypothetical protein HDU67_004378 [Dinochytrium kinnereticum]|nr:hypothetical protein HDU67_004378 [Dinochytrium kinnereticum]
MQDQSPSIQKSRILGIALITITLLAGGSLASRFRDVYIKTISARSKAVEGFLVKVVGFCELIESLSVSDAKRRTGQCSSAISQLLSSIDTQTESIIEQGAQVQAKRIRHLKTGELKDATLEIRNQVMDNIYASYNFSAYADPSSDKDDDSWVSKYRDMKQSIRDIKGKLLSRHNFPKINK